MSLNDRLARVECDVYFTLTERPQDMGLQILSKEPVIVQVGGRTGLKV